MPRRVLILSALLSAFGWASAQSAHILFDDFKNASTSELAAHGWIMRTEKGFPGIPGAVWGPEGFSLQDDPSRPGNRLLSMSSSTDGTPAHTHQSQLCHQRKYLDGTYAARLRFTDSPAAGPGGDQLVESFYLISPSKKPMDPSYGEIDFEYLPVGGWGAIKSTLYTTTWDTFQLEPWIADRTSTNKTASFGGWHTLVAQVKQGTVRYFIDGRLFAEHGGKVYGEMMSINFNLWFIRDQLAPAPETRTWEEDIDWVYFHDGEMVTPESVEAAVADLRRRNVAFLDSVPSSGLISPCNF